MNEEQARKISELLNTRGFVIDEDIRDIPTSYTKFAAWVNANEELIRRAGYSGGIIRSWSSGFWGAGCAYGVTDEGMNIKDQWIDQYCVLTEDEAPPDTVVSEVIKYGLFIAFNCTCGHKSAINPKALPKNLHAKPISSLQGKCSKCSLPTPPIMALHKPWYN